jgi:hypothetical protein
MPLAKIDAGREAFVAGKSRYRSPMNVKYLTAWAIAGLFLGPTSVEARGVRVWSYNDLFKASDVVAIVEPIKSESMEPIKSEGSLDQFEWAYAQGLIHGVSTTFKVDCYFKGAPPIAEIVVRHFEGKDAGMLVNGPDLVHFVIGPRSLDMTAPQQDKPGARQVIESLTVPPQWLAFLKRNGDGTFAPVAGQIDSVMSFRLLEDRLPRSVE